MTELRFTKDHEWIRVEGDIGTVGITDFAQDQLGDVVFVDLPEVGRTVSQGEEIAVVESVKAAAEVYAPVAGEIVETNSALDESPELVNAEAESGAWFFKLKIANPAELESLMDEAAYRAFVENEG